MYAKKKIEDFFFTNALPLLQVALRALECAGQRSDTPLGSGKTKKNILFYSALKVLSLNLTICWKLLKP